MEKKFQIFISSTFQDLIEQRERIVNTVLRLKHHPIGMEIFNAAAVPPWETIKRHIDNADYYVLILSHRYGSEDKEGMGFTEKEYDYATQKNIPCIAFIINPSVSWKPEFIDKGENAVKLAHFKEKVERNLVINYWKSTDDLATHVSISLPQLIADFPREGWVRASKAASPELAEQLARLLHENQELRARLNSQPEDELEVLSKAIDNTTFPFTLMSGEDQQVPLRDFLLSITEVDGNPYLSKIGTCVDSRLTGNKHSEEDNYRHWDQLAKPLKELAHLGLLDRERSANNNDQWHLTDKGRAMYVRLKHIATL